MTQYNTMMLIRWRLRQQGTYQLLCLQFQMRQSQHNNNCDSVSNLKISTDKIVFNPKDYTAEIVLSNLHQKYFLFFKIKTKIQKLFDVKPCLGCIKPGEQQKIALKPLKKIEAEEIPKLEQTLVFLLQAVNQLDPEMSKQKEEVLWRQIKNKKADIKLGYCSVKLNVTFSGAKQKQKEFMPVFNKFDSKIDSRYSNEIDGSVKAISSISSLPRSNLKASNQSQQTITDLQLSKKFQDLKEKEQKLLKQRERIFQGPKITHKVKRPSPIKLLVVFLITFLLGNYLRSICSLKTEEPKPMEKGFFDWIS